MTELNGEEIKKLKRGELAGTAATIVCGAALAFFIACYTIARVKGLKTLEIAAVIVSAAVIAAGAVAAAYCNLKFGAALDRLVKRYVLDVFVENAALMHPEKSVLALRLGVENSVIILRVNGYNKEKITFDFSAFGKLSASRKLSALTEIENRLCVTFCRLYERGGDYKSVSYTESEGTRRKSAKTTFIIQNGVPEKKSFKIYLKNK